MMAGIRPPDSDIEERLDITLAMMKSMWPVWRICDALQVQFDITRHAAKDDVSRARAKMREEDGTSRQEKRAKGSAFLEDIMANIGTQVREKILAFRQYSKLHGLDEQAPLESAPDEDIRVTIGDWRADYAQQLKEGGARSTNGNGRRS